MLMSWSDDLGNVIMRFTGGLFCLFVWFGPFVSCYLEDFDILNEIFCLFSSRPSQKNIIPHTAEVAPLYLLCWSA